MHPTIVPPTPSPSPSIVCSTCVTSQSTPARSGGDSETRASDHGSRARGAQESGGVRTHIRPALHTELAGVHPSLPIVGLSPVSRDPAPPALHAAPSAPPACPRGAVDSGARVLRPLGCPHTDSARCAELGCVFTFSPEHIAASIERRARTSPGKPRYRPSTHIVLSEPRTKRARTRAPAGGDGWDRVWW